MAAPGDGTVRSVTPPAYHHVECCRRAHILHTPGATAAKHAAVSWPGARRTRRKTARFSMKCHENIEHHALRMARKAGAAARACAKLPAATHKHHAQEQREKLHARSGGQVCKQASARGNPLGPPPPKIGTNTQASVMNSAPLFPLPLCCALSLINFNFRKPHERGSPFSLGKPQNITRQRKKT